MSVIRRAAIAALAVAIITSACMPPSAPDVTARQNAAAWLVSQFDPATKLIPSAFTPGADDLSGSAFAATSLRIAGTGAPTAIAAVSALAPKVDEFVKDSAGNDLPGSLARLILAVVSVGQNPRSFGGFDLVARLEATMATTGPDAGRFGVQSATYDGAFRQGLALAALSLITPAPPSITPAGAWLTSQQCSDGSWMPYRSDLAQPCGFDPVTFTSPDTNSAAMAQMGLAAVGAFAPTSPVTWLNAVRNPDGGWSYDGNPGSISDPDSTGLVMGALRSAGVTPDAAAVNALVAFQFGYGAAPSATGSFYYPFGTPTPNLFATNDAMIGLSPAVWPGVLAG